MIIKKGTFGTKKFSQIDISFSASVMGTHQFIHDVADTFTPITIVSTPTYVTVTKPIKPTFNPA